ncbi:O-methyltransferase [Marinilabiliaceae bacterium JC017]|nr:O-methyltransferase [Marinilabiliaceae bacterium JC017]
MTYSLDLDQYILEHIDVESDILSDLNRQTHLKILRSRMISGHLQGQILKMICRMINPLNVLELGTFTGYSAISMALGLSRNDAHIDTIEINDELQSCILEFFRKAKVENRISLHIGPAIDIIPRLEKKYDLVFIDADKRQYPEYYNLIFEHVNVGGYIIADNILWDGKVVENVAKNDTYTKGILEFNEMIKNDCRVEKVILPVRDGLFLIRKK